MIGTSTVTVAVDLRVASASDTHFDVSPLDLTVPADVVASGVTVEPSVPVPEAALDRSIAVEYRAVGKVAGVELAARIDVLEYDVSDGMVVGDWKTGATPLAWSELAQIRQSVLYSVLVRTDTRFGSPRKAHMYFLSNQDVVEIDLDGLAGKHAKAEAEQFVDVNVGRIHEAAEASTFVVRPGDWCGECPYREVCPASATHGGTGVCS